MTATTRPPAAPPPDLPVHLSHFIGRERELCELDALLGGTRLLTLTGAGGSGKTRLAAALAARSSGRFARIAWTDLAPITDGRMIPAILARNLAVPDRPGIAPLTALRDDLGDTPTLIILDNCEHLVEECAEVVEALLLGCSGLTVLTTSREALAIASETAWLVPPLERTEAMQLFVERAHASLPTFRLGDGNIAAVTEICRRLDGLPLAIELAAARVRALSPAAIAERLDDAFRLLSTGSRTALPRQRTLRGMMDWSYQLLTEREQALLRRLSVFAGSFSLEAAEAVCAADPLAEEDILDGVAALVDKSLVVMDGGDGEARYHLLETVRQYAAERLATAGERADFYQAHAEWFLRLIEGQLPELIGGERTPGMVARLRVDSTNFRAACVWALADPARTSIGLRFGGALFWYWYGIGRFGEAEEFLDRILAAADGGADPLDLGRAMASRGLVALAQGDAVETRGYLSRAVALLAAHGASHDEVMVVRIKFAASYVIAGDPRAADLLLRELEADVDRTSDWMTRIFWTFWVAWAAILVGETTRARRHLEETMALARLPKHDVAIAHTSMLLGRAALLEGALEEALGHFRVGLMRHRVMGETWGFLLSLGSMATLASLGGEHERAVILQAGLDRLRIQHGLALPDPDREERTRILTAATEVLGERFDGIYASGQALGGDALVELALAQTTDPQPAAQATDESAADAVPVAAADGDTHTIGLEVDALGPLQVRVDGRSLDATAWGSARPRELLLFLLLHPDGVTKEQVGLALWPDASSSQLRNSFHVTLHRLRKVLGNPSLVQLAGERYRVAPGVLTAFDVPRFEAEAVAARRAHRSDAPDAVERLERAVSLYRGDLMDGEPVGDWHLTWRDRLRELYTQAALDLGGRYLADARLERAAETFRRLLAREELHEGAVRSLMTIHARLGERNQALRIYQRFCEVLMRELGAEPDEETVELAEGIRNGES